MAVKKIGILTSGGDCGGLNAVIHGAALTALAKNIDLYIIPNGYAGLYNLKDFDSLLKLDAKKIEDDVPVFLAGSEAGNSRVKIGKIKDDNKYTRIKEGLEKFQLDAILIAGGDDTGSVVVDLSERGIPCIHLPKTMDLDLMTYSVGGDSAINRIAEFLRDLRTTGHTHNRIIVLEVFGRYAGHTAFRGGIAGGADAVLIPEVAVDFDVLYEFVKKLYFRRLNESDVKASSVMIVVAEGLKDSSGKELVDESIPPDAFGHRKLMGAGVYVVKQLESRMKADPDVKAELKKHGIFVESIYEIPEIREVRPGHLVRSGFTTAYDANFGIEVGAAAVHLATSDIFGVTVVSYREGVIEYMAVKEAIVQRHVAVNSVALYESMGICFGRKATTFKPEMLKISGKPIRPY